MDEPYLNMEEASEHSTDDHFDTPSPPQPVITASQQSEHSIISLGASSDMKISPPLETTSTHNRQLPNNTRNSESTEVFMVEEVGDDRPVTAASQQSDLQHYDRPDILESSADIESTIKIQSVPSTRQGSAIENNVGLQTRPDKRNRQAAENNSKTQSRWGKRHRVAAESNVKTQSRPDTCQGAAAGDNSNPQQRSVSPADTNATETILNACTPNDELMTRTVQYTAEYWDAWSAIATKVYTSPAAIKDHCDSIAKLFGIKLLLAKGDPTKKKTKSWSSGKKDKAAV